MREIKFRAFACDRLFYPEIFSFDSKGISFQTELGYLSSDKFEQFTGLQDKNGVDIYEGDIVRIIFDSYVPNCDHTVKWSNSESRYIGDMIEKEPHSDFHQGVTYEFADHTYCEIIGNIHEETK